MFVENKRLLSEAKLELKKSKRKDYYKILGVNKQANEDEIKKAYRKRALLHHPGRGRHPADIMLELRDIGSWQRHTRSPKIPCTKFHLKRCSYLTVEQPFNPSKSV